MMKYENLVMAIFDAIEQELNRIWWNKFQTENESPFKNSGTAYGNNVFTVSAYEWGEPDEDGPMPNFQYKDFRASWYKHSHRWLFFERTDGELTAEFLNQMLDDCLASLRKKEESA